MAFPKMEWKKEWTVELKKLDESQTHARVRCEGIKGVNLEPVSKNLFPVPFDAISRVLIG